MARVRTIEWPADLVGALEAVFTRERIAVGVDWHDDGSRTYTLPNDGLDADEAERLVQKAFDSLAEIIRDAQD